MPDSPSAKNSNDGSGPPGGGDLIQSGNSSSGIPGNTEQEKRLRREIANSNERRRMQSINAGFNSLRNLLPHHEGEKLSKVSGYRNLFCFYSIARLLNVCTMRFID